MYLLDANGEPYGVEKIDEDALNQASQLFLDNSRRIVAKTDTSNGQVSTVFLVHNHQWGSGPPLIYETMIFNGTFAGAQWRYSTREQAEAHHKYVVDTLNAGGRP